MQNTGLQLYPPLAALQAQQKRHDRDFSRDIMGMTEWSALTHYCLHQGKYIGRLFGFEPRSPKFSFNQIVTDSFIVTLATANRLKLKLERELESSPPLTFSVKTPAALATTLVTPQARMAEALLTFRQDPGTARAEASAATLTFCRVLGGVAMGLSLDLPQMIDERLKHRAAKSLFGPR